jgi:outer membrane lipoprotein-sorting protein
VDLTRAKTVVGHDEVDGLTVVTARDPDTPELGTIRLAFSADPVVLTQWTVTDEAGGQTTVTLGPLTTGQSYPVATFSITAEVDKFLKRNRN